MAGAEAGAWGPAGAIDEGAYLHRRRASRLGGLVSEPHPIVSAAAEGRFPEWAVASEDRREHMSRVAVLLGSWAEALGLAATESTRWRAAGYLHDALRDERPDALRPRVSPELRDLPDPILHGPAVAERLRVEGVLDGELLRALAFHTIGDAGLRGLGRALYAADFLEPGRTFRAEWRAALRERMPAQLDDVVREVVGARVVRMIERGCGVQPRTIAFWNSLAADCR